MEVGGLGLGLGMHSIDLNYQLLALKAGFFVPQKGHSIIGYVPEGNG